MRTRQRAVPPTVAHWVAALATEAPEVYAQALEVVQQVRRRQLEWTLQETPEDVLAEAASEVWVTRAEFPAATREWQVQVTARRMRRRLRRTQVQVAVFSGVKTREVLNAEPLETLFEQLNRDALLRRVEAAFAPDEWQLLLEVCDPDANCKQVAMLRCGPTATARELHLMHGKVRKQRSRLLRAARDVLADALAVDG